MGDGKAIDAMVHDGLTNPFTGKHMAAEASEVAAELELTRPDMDRWALRSHQLAVKATDEGRLPEEIVPVTVKGKKGDTVVEIDEGPRRDTSLETLAKLPPIFIKDGTHTAGNSPGVNDGAGALVLASDEWARRNGKPALATIVAHAQVADDFPLPGPHSGQRVQVRAREGRAQGRRHRPVGDQRGVRVGDAELDPRCSASTRTRSTSTAARSRSGTRSAPRARGSSGRSCYELRRRGGGLGCAAICSGGGQGDAVIIEVNGG